MISKTQTKPNTEKIILGIDPGTNVMGYGVIRVMGNKAELVVMGIIDMRKDNEKDILDIPEKYLKGVSFHYVEDVADVWKIRIPTMKRGRVHTNVTK